MSVNKEEKMTIEEAFPHGKLVIHHTWMGCTLEQVGKYCAAMGYNSIQHWLDNRDTDAREDAEGDRRLHYPTLLLVDDQTEAAWAACEIWSEMNDDEKSGVRVGMFPVALMRQYDPFPTGPNSNLCVVALMELAKKTGGMIM